MDLETHTILANQLTQLYVQLHDLQWEHRRDLSKMGAAIEHLLSDLSKESVNCHRTRKLTKRYQDLNIQIQEALDNFEKHLLLAKLLKS